MYKNSSILFLFDAERSSFSFTLIRLKHKIPLLGASFVIYHVKHPKLERKCLVFAFKPYSALVFKMQIVSRTFQFRIWIYRDWYPHTKSQDGNPKSVISFTNRTRDHNRMGFKIRALRQQSRDSKEIKMLSLVGTLEKTKLLQMTKQQMTT